jgi:hypothetical protein
VDDAKKKVRRTELVTIRVTHAELVDANRLAYLRKTSLAKLFRAWVSAELAEVDPLILRRLHGAKRRAS